MRACCRQPLLLFVDDDDFIPLALAVALSTMRALSRLTIRGQLASGFGTLSRSIFSHRVRFAVVRAQAAVDLANRRRCSLKRSRG